MTRGALSLQISHQIKQEGEIHKLVPGGITSPPQNKIQSCTEGKSRDCVLSSGEE